jgi:hypothetical protein
VSQYSSGHTKIADLIKAEMLSTTQISKETSRVENAVKTHVISEVSGAKTTITMHMTTEMKEATDRIGHIVLKGEIQAISDGKRQQLLQSLKFPAMNERRNHVMESHEGTFKWIFESTKNLDHESNSEDSDDDVSDDSGSFSQSRSNYSADSCEDNPWDNFDE